MYTHSLKIKKNVDKYRFVILTFLVWKITLSVFGLIIIQFVDYHPTFPYYESLKSKYDFLYLFIWGGFDGVHYLDIAQDGYTKQFTQAFFPFYPLLISFFSFGFIPKLVVGVLINNLGLFVGLIFLQNIIQNNFKKIDYRYVILIFLAYPFSFFFNAVYNEGIFFALILICFQSYQYRRTLMMILTGIFACTTRLAGIYLIPSLAVFTLLDQKRKKTSSLMAISFISFGLIIYMIYLEIKFGDYLYFITSQNYFGNARSSDLVLLPQVIYRYIKIILSISVTSNAFIIAITEFFVAIVFLILPIIFHKKIPIGYIIFSLLVVIVPSLTGTFGSMPRYALMSFPVFILIGFLSQKYKMLLITVFVILQLYFLSLFISGTFVS